MFKSEDFDDLVQMINLKLLEGKLERIKEKYNGSVSFNTYFSKSVYNLCLGEWRRRNKQLKTTSLDDALNLVKDDNTTEQLTIAEELERLKIIFLMNHRSKFKLKICLKLVYRLAISESDFTRFCPSFLVQHKSEFMNIFQKGTHELNDKTLYQTVCPIFNYCEQKDNTPDAIRKWVNKKIKSLIEELNGDPPQANYSKETLGILLEKYFQLAA